MEINDQESEKMGSDCVKPLSPKEITQSVSHDERNITKSTSANVALYDHKLIIYYYNHNITNKATTIYQVRNYNQVENYCRCWLIYTTTGKWCFEKGYIGRLVT